MVWPVHKIISGGQTGVDRAALDWAAQIGLARGGWCPLHRLAEDGPIPEAYPMRETPSEDYAQRTEWNVRDSDGTLIITWGPPTGGTAYTIECARAQGKPCCVVDALQETREAEILTWLAVHDIGVLNVAGPRASNYPQAYGGAFAILDRLYGAAMRAAE